MRHRLAAIAIALLYVPVNAEAMTCTLGPACGVDHWSEYIVAISTANDAGTEVWIVTWDDVWPLRLLRYDPLNCTSLGWQDVPGNSGITGLARDGDALWYVCGHEGVIYKIDTTTWTLISQIPTPSHEESNPQSKGVAWDGQYLWHVDWVYHLIYKLDPETGAVLSAMPAPGELPWGLEYMDGILYCIDQRGTIYAIETTAGAVLGECAPYGSEFSLSSQGLAARPDGSFWLLTRWEFEVYSFEVDWSVGTQEASWSVIKSLY